VVSKVKVVEFREERMLQVRREERMNERRWGAGRAG
jgi:hypothetical protein